IAATLGSICFNSMAAGVRRRHDRYLDCCIPRLSARGRMKLISSTGQSMSFDPCSVSDMRWRSAFVNVCSGRAVDEQAEQFRPAVLAARVHQQLSSIDQAEVEISNQFCFARTDRLTNQRSVGCRDCGETAASYRTKIAPCVLNDLRLLGGIEPRGCADHKAG